MLNAKASIEIKQEIRSIKSHNVIGKLVGSDRKSNGEYLIYTAHWDHLGRHPELQAIRFLTVRSIMHQALRPSSNSRPPSGK
jgi:hypothetical protein